MLSLSPLILLFLAQFTGTTGIELYCLTCYSPELLYRWPITGLPILPKPNADATTDKRWNEKCGCQAADDCKDTETSHTTAASAKVNGGVLKSCASFCVAMQFQDPATPGSTLYVRGCHIDLTGIKSGEITPTYNAAETSYCETGNPTMYSEVLDKYAEYPQAMIFCKGTAAFETTKWITCNALSDISLCESTIDTSKLRKTCEVCTSKKNCNGKPSKAGTVLKLQYCMKTDAKIAGKREVSKGMAVNAIGDKRCVNMKYNLPTQTRRLLEYKATRCYCDSDDCNAGSKLNNTVPLMFIAALTYIIMANTS